MIVRADKISLPNLHILLLSADLIASTAKLCFLTEVRLIVLVGERLQLHAVEHDLFFLVRAPSLRVITIVVLLCLFGGNLFL